MKRKFTMVEILVVAIVVAILAVGALMLFGGEAETANAAGRAKTVAQVNEMLDILRLNGVNCADGASPCNTASTTTLLSALSTGITYTDDVGVSNPLKLGYSPTPGSYELSGASPAKRLVAKSSGKP